MVVPRSRNDLNSVASIPHPSDLRSVFLPQGGRKRPVSPSLILGEGGGGGFPRTNEASRLNATVLGAASSSLNAGQRIGHVWKQQRIGRLRVPCSMLSDAEKFHRNIGPGGRLCPISNAQVRLLLLVDQVSMADGGRRDGRAFRVHEALVRPSELGRPELQVRVAAARDDGVVVFERVEEEPRWVVVVALGGARAAAATVRGIGMHAHGVFIISIGQPGGEHLALEVGAIVDPFTPSLMPVGARPAEIALWPPSPLRIALYAASNRRMYAAR